MIEESEIINEIESLLSYLLDNNFNLLHNIKYCDIFDWYDISIVIKKGVLAPFSWEDVRDEVIQVHEYLNSKLGFSDIIINGSSCALLTKDPYNGLLHLINIRSLSITFSI